MRRPTLAEVGYALLFAVPGGVGATAFAVNLAGNAPVILAFGAALTLGLFVLVLVAVTSGGNAERVD